MTTIVYAGNFSKNEGERDDFETMKTFQKLFITAGKSRLLSNHLLYNIIGINAPEMIIH
jgi:hypothetical protein